VERGNTALSKARAETVANYLARTWGVPRSRMIIEARDLPATPSRSDDSDGVAENRRVELASDEPAILDPLVTRSVERRINPDRIRFSPEVESEAGVAGWRLTVTRGEQQAHEFSGTGPLPKDIDWAFADDLRDLKPQNETLRYRLMVKDAAGQSLESESGAIDVHELTIRKKREQEVADKIISRFNLILFDFNSPQLGRRNDRIMDRFILPEIGEGSRIWITGATDRIGEEGYNLSLSQKRADNAARALHLRTESVTGKGASDPFYDNNLPEGRFYNRTVQIEVETPRKK
jgi:outer membrane protein OmpA-like peptidoglycan-associated protein